MSRGRPEFSPVANKQHTNVAVAAVTTTTKALRQFDVEYDDVDFCAESYGISPAETLSEGSHVSLTPALKQECEQPATTIQTAAPVEIRSIPSSRTLQMNAEQDYTEVLTTVATAVQDAASVMTAGHNQKPSDAAVALTIAATIQQLFKQTSSSTICCVFGLGCMAKPRDTPAGWSDSVLVIKDQFSASFTTSPMVIDCNFRAKFTIARPSPQYQRYLATIPTLFIGTMDSLISAIHRHCAAIHHTLVEQDRVAPPWRKPEPLIRMYQQCLSRALEDAEGAISTLLHEIVSGNSHEELDVHVAQQLCKCVLHPLLSNLAPRMEEVPQMTSPKGSTSVSASDDGDEDYFEKVPVSPTSTISSEPHEEAEDPVCSFLAAQLMFYARRRAMVRPLGGF